MTVERPIVLDRAWIFEGPDGPTIRKAATPSESHQMPDDPYNYQQGEGGLERPPYDMDALVSLMGGKNGGIGNSLHTRCVKQKASDTVGRGIELRAKEEDAKGDSSEETRWHEFIEEVENDERGEGSFKERLTWAHEDFESVGWAVLEVGRRADDTLDGLWHIPAHTVRAHRDGKRFAQKRGGKLTWFKRFGVKGDVDRNRGGWSDKVIRDRDVRGNEVIVVRNYTPVSSYYGLPDHIPALMAMAGWKAQAEFNFRFFGNQAVPSYAVIIEGADLSPALEDLILDHFRQIKGDPARTIIIPVPVVPGLGESFMPKVRFERLSVDIKDASFRMYRQDTALEICIAHGVPPYRIGWPLMGSLGGATAQEMTSIYNDSIVQPRQETWEQRLDRALLGSKGLDIKSWKLKANELDVRNEMLDIQKAQALYSMGVVTPADNAAYFGYERTDPAGKEYIPVPLAPGAQPPPPPGAEPEPEMPAPEAPIEEMAKAWQTEVLQLATLRKRVSEVMGNGNGHIAKHGDHDQSSHGSWATGGGGSSGGPDVARSATQAAPEKVVEFIPGPEYVKDSGKGTANDPLKTSDLAKAVTTLSSGGYVDFYQPRGVSTLIDELARLGQEAREKGEKAPLIDMARVSINGTNLFMEANLGVPRIEMPQLAGIPEPGSRAATEFPVNDAGGVDLTVAFAQHLMDDLGVDVAQESIPAEWLRASQSELDGVKVASMAEWVIGGHGHEDPAGPGIPGILDRRIVVTKDDYIVDGHHTWGAIAATQFHEGENLEVKAYRIDMSITDALREANEWTAKMGIAPRAVGKRRRRR